MAVARHGYYGPHQATQDPSRPGDARGATRAVDTSHHSPATSPSRKSPRCQGPERCHPADGVAIQAGRLHHLSLATRTSILSPFALPVRGNGGLSHRTVRALVIARISHAGPRASLMICVFPGQRPLLRVDVKGLERNQGRCNHLGPLAYRPASIPPDLYRCTH